MKLGNLLAAGSLAIGITGTTLVGLETTSHASAYARDQSNTAWTNGVKPISLAEYTANRDSAVNNETRPLVADCSPVYLKSLANSRYTSAELHDSGDYQNMLRARATEDGSWENFTVCYDDAGYDYLYSEAADRYVSARVNLSGNSYGMLRATASTVGGWEKFTISCPGTDYCTIRSQQNGAFVTAELSYTGNNYGMLRAQASSVGSWEKFA